MSYHVLLVSELESLRIHDFVIAFWNLKMNGYEVFASSFARANVL